MFFRPHLEKEVWPANNGGSSIVQCHVFCHTSHELCEQYLTFPAVAVSLLSSGEGKRRKCSKEPELLLVFSQTCTVLHLRILGNLFCGFLSPNDLLAEYSGFYCYLAGMRDFMEVGFFPISSRLSLYLNFSFCHSKCIWWVPTDSLLMLSLVICFFWCNLF